MMKLLRHLCFLVIGVALIACDNKDTSLSPLSKNDVILAFGDSLTYGTGAEPGSSYPEKLAKITGLKVINAGISGEETRDSRLRIASLLNQYYPMLVIVCLGGNDLIRKRPIADIKENLRYIIQTIRKTGTQVILLGVPTLGMGLTVPDFYKELGDELGVPVDTSILVGLLAKPEYKSDYIHLNAVGYNILAERIAEFLKEHKAI